MVFITILSIFVLAGFVGYNAGLLTRGGEIVNERLKG